jgi:ferredoxin/flavodoxin
MQNRRSFIINMIIICASFILPAFFKKRILAESDDKFKTNDPKRAIVIWFSETGNTERAGRLIAKRWEMGGVKSDAYDYRDFDIRKISDYDLIALGCPVYNLDIPIPFKAWLEKMPPVKNIPVASFVTFGGPGDNQHNTACALLEIASEKGGIPAGMTKFGNMSTFAPTWSLGNSERILKYRHKPDESTYNEIREFAARILKAVRDGRKFEIDTEFNLMEMFSFLMTPSLSKLAISDHRIDPEKCIKCGTCVKKCPTGAIDLKNNKVDTGKCIACMGCVNNCPVQAVKMKFIGKPVYGFNKFLEENKITIVEPEELRK